MLTRIQARKLVAALFPKSELARSEDRPDLRTSRPGVARFRPNLEELEVRLTPAATATYVAGVFTLTVTTGSLPAVTYKMQTNAAASCVRCL